MTATTTAEVQRLVEALHAGSEHDMVAFEEGTLELAWGWRVMVQPRRWVETRDFQDMLIGHGPTYVTRTGRVFLTGSAKPPEFYEEGLSWELSANRGLWDRLRMWWRGWRAEEHLNELTRPQILVALPDGSWAHDFYVRLTRES